MTTHTAVQDSFIVELNGLTKTVWVPTLTEPDEIMDYVEVQRSANLLTLLQEITYWSARLPSDHPRKRMLQRWMRFARVEVLNRMNS